MKTMVEVFKTNITSSHIADLLTIELQRLFPLSAVNFDLDDCDNILRVEGDNIRPAHIIAHLQQRGHACEVLL